ncbi:MAG: hypothetical protein ACLQEQ_05660 [Nitrososphaerales archaeon]
MPQIVQVRVIAAGATTAKKVGDEIARRYPGAKVSEPKPSENLQGWRVYLDLPYFGPEEEEG